MTTQVLAEFFESNLYLISSNCLSEQSKRILLGQLEEVVKFLNEHKEINIGAEYPSVIERWNVFTLCTTIRAHTGHPTALFNEEWRGFLRTFSYGSATARRAVDVAVDHAVSSTSTSVCESVLRALEAYSETLPLCFPSSTQRLKEEASMRFASRDGEGNDPSARRGRADDDTLELRKRRALDVDNKPKPLNVTTKQTPHIDHISKPRSSRTIAHHECTSAFHGTFGLGLTASHRCAMCVTCHMLEGVFLNNRARCGWANHSFPPKETSLRHRLSKYPRVLSAAKARIEQMATNQKSLAPISVNDVLKLVN